MAQAGFPFGGKSVPRPALPEPRGRFRPGGRAGPVSPTMHRRAWM
jgi:hypothetical protein